MVWKNSYLSFLIVIFIYILPVSFCSDLFIPTSVLHVGSVPTATDPSGVVSRSQVCQPWPPWPLSSLAYVPAAGGRHSVVDVSGSSKVGRRLQCLVNTAFGSHLSAPFQLRKVVFETSTSSERKTVIKHRRVSNGALVWLTCQPPRDDQTTVGNTRISFVVNNTARLRVDAFPDKYLLAKPPVAVFESNRPVTTRQYYLGIRGFNRSDSGVYACIATDAGTGRHLWTGSLLYYLQHDDSEQTSNTTGPASASLTRHSLLVEEAENVSIICPETAVGVSRGADESRRPLTSPRTRWNPDFAVISLDYVRPRDEGEYICPQGETSRDGGGKVNVLGITLRVVRRNRSAHSPIRRVSAALGESVVLNCTSLHDTLAHPVWYFNGRLRNDFAAGNLSDTAASRRFLISSLRPEDTGVYQCVLLDPQGDWSASQAFAVSLTGDRLHSIEDRVAPHQLQSPVTLPPGLVTVHLGDTVMFTCFPPPTPVVSPMVPSTDASSPLFSSFSVVTNASSWLSTSGVALPWLGRSIAVKLTLTRACQFGVYTCLTPASVDSGEPTGSAHRRRRRRLVVLARQIRLVPAGSRLHYSPAATPCPPPAPAFRQVSPRSRHLADYSTGQRAKRQSLDENRLQSPAVGYADLLSGPYAPEPSPESQSALPWQQSQHGLLPSPRQEPLGAARQRQDPARRPQANVGRRLPAPNASSIGDNLAANISWRPVSGAHFYRVQVRSRLSSEQRWSQPFQLEEPVPECCQPSSSASSIPADNCCHLPPVRLSYVTNRQPAALEPGRIYQFLVQALRNQHQRQPDIETGSSTIGGAGAPLLLGDSQWSEPVSFEYISKVAPVITVAKRMTDGVILVQWSLARSAVGFPVDHFLLLYRAEERLDTGQLVYQGFHPVVVPGRDTMEFKLAGLAHGKGYQIVVYGVHLPSSSRLRPEETIFTGGANGRRITVFSHEVFVEPTPTKNRDSLVTGSSMQTPSDGAAVSNNFYTRENYLDSNRLMFTILGTLAGLMLLVMVFLVILCFCRQRRDKRRRLRHGDGAQVALGGKCQKLARAGSANSRKQVPNTSAGHFMLDQLTASDHHTEAPVVEATQEEDQTYSLRTSLMHYHHRHRQQPYNLTYPPPGNPAPPPPELIPSDHQSEALSMTDRGVTYQRQPATTTMHMIDSNMAGNTIGQPGLMAVVPAYHTGAVSHNAAARVLPPYEMKREPPSGGSVHEDETDNENACELLTYLPPTSYRMVYRHQHHPSTGAPFFEPLAPNPHPAGPLGYYGPVGIPHPAGGIVYPPGQLAYYQQTPPDSLPIACYPSSSFMSSLVYTASQSTGGVSCWTPGGAPGWTQVNNQHQQPITFPVGCYNTLPEEPQSENSAEGPRDSRSRSQSVNMAAAGCRSASQCSQSHEGLQERASYRHVRHSSVPPDLSSHLSPFEVNLCAETDGGVQRNQPMIGEGPVGQTGPVDPDDENVDSLNSLSDEPLMTSSPRQASPGQENHHQHHHYRFHHQLPPDTIEEHRLNHHHQQPSSVVAYAGMPVRHPRPFVAAYPNGQSPSCPMDHYRHQSQTDPVPACRQQPTSYWLVHKPSLPAGTQAHPKLMVYPGAFPPVPMHRNAGQPPMVFVPAGEQQSLCQGAPRVRDYSEYGIPNVFAGNHHREGEYSTQPGHRNEGQPVVYRHPNPPLPLISTNGSSRAC